MAHKRSRAAFEADLQAQQSPYVFFGTPLPPLDPQTRDDGSYVPIWKQEVTDERGRKRLHGAFTGGFSAGYFNTVGSKDGWTPQAFVSSRTNRSKAVQNAEDFMDEEDLADAEEAKVLETKGGFSGFGSTEDEVGGKGPFMDLFRRQGETMGIRLLRKMGWSEGQHIGNKDWKTRARHSHNSEDTAQGSTSRTPVKMISFVRKADTKGLGLGFDAGLEVQRKADGVSKQRSATKSKAARAKPKTGFGVGILNDTGSDDEDPYGMGPKLSYSRLANERTKKKKAESGLLTSSSNPLLTSRPVFVKKTTPTSGFRRCHDGELPIDGFVLSSKGAMTQDKMYRPPKIPEGWTPKKQASSEPGSVSAYLSTADLAKASSLDPAARAAVLGEKMLPGQSVFDFLSPAARDKIAAATNNPNLPAGTYQPPARSPTPPSEESLIPPLDAATAKSALQRSTGSFVPYSDNPGKLSRYRNFLTYRSNSQDADENPHPKCPPGTSREEFLSELQEFANAAAIFKPMSGAMANRFTSSGSVDSVGQTSVSKGEDGKNMPLISRPKTQLAPEQEAAKMSMYGPLTRKTMAFYPTRLLCKRFGVTAPLHVQPEPGNGAVATSSGAGIGRQGTAVDVLAGFGNRFTSGGMQNADDGEKAKNRLEIVGKKDLDDMRRAAGLPALGEAVKRKDRETAVDPNRNEALEAERPSEQTFKDIFANDD